MMFLQFKKLHVILIIAAFFVLLIDGCSKKVSEGKILNIKVDLVKINTWVNMMPNAGSSFHISGKVIIKNDEMEDLNNFQLQEAIITQGDNLIYKTHLLFSSVSGLGPILKGNEKSFDFKTRKGLDIINKIDLNKPLNIEMVFSSMSKIYKFKMDNIKIEKVY